ncbi:hypothetical protein A7U60_g5250 [Sanghuangporus baumii]|uniref:Uncharacterized protein n=1 Tax=Sanghuangporus baumii TaxID=108892 RepID=A0A9Q5N8J3_SANBA|nr:hypothetical protein A7U60_g5250 [Sanghuangporus baumii]
MVLLTRKLASRKFIDLVNLAACKWANWDPTIPVEPGDYSRIDRETDQFQKEGNIFRETEIADIVSKYSLITGPRVDDYIIQSLNVKGALETAGPTFGGQWQFGSKRAALLLLYGSRITRLPEELFEELKETKWGHGKHIVSHIHSCPAYALYLSDRDNETVMINLHADVPLGPAPDVGINAIWTASGVSGTFQRACADGSVFVPLYQVKELKKRRGRRRQSPDPLNDDKEDWVPVDFPWNILDDDGKEMADVSVGVVPPMLVYPHY